MRQLKNFSGKKSAFEITESFQFLFQSHTKHYHLYYLEVAFKTFLPWLIVYKKKKYPLHHNSGHIHSFLH